MVIDVITFNGEYDLLEMRLAILDKYVDKFIIIEAPTTFSGKPKPLYYEQGQGRYTEWAGKIRYFVIDENYTEEEIEEARASPNTAGAGHWEHEFLQKESIKKALIDLNDDDVVFVGDVDEIWNPEALLVAHGPFKLKLQVYTYFLNNKSSEEFWGTLVSPYSFIRNSCLNHLRTNSFKTLYELGYHFTSMGGYDEVKRKLSDSYTRESYWTEQVESLLEENIALSHDFLGRNFKYLVDESELPQYILDNKIKYGHLFK